MPGASARIAEKLAKQKAAAAAAPDEAETSGTDEAEAEDTEVVAEAPKRKMTVKERAAASREKRALAAAQADAEAEEADEDEGAEDSDEPAEGYIAAAAKEAKATKVKAGAKGTGPGKKAPSPAQLAAREKFAAASRARAAEKAGKPVQTPEQVKAKQNADRKVQRDQIAAAEADRPTRESTSKPKKLKETAAQAKARIAREKAEAARVAKAAGTKKAKAGTSEQVTKQLNKNAAKDRKPQGETKAKIIALAGKGKTRPQIMAETGLSYASVMYHLRGVETVAAARGSIFVDSELGANGKKLRNGKTENVSRSEAMRRMYIGGDAIGDIARHFDVRYQIAYTAIRPILGTADEEE